MQHLENEVAQSLPSLLKPVDTNWQPADILPNAGQETFFEEVKNIQAQAKELSYDLFAVLIGDAITEEALPTYESWLYLVEGIRPEEGHAENAWLRWVRGWTAEENRHGDLLNKYLYLSGRVDMRQMEGSTQYLIADGFDIQTGNDPYRNFVYTSFQELATQLSHRRVGAFAKQQGSPYLAKICSTIATDEGRHAHAYSLFIDKIFQLDNSEMTLAFADMMRKKIVMPAHFLREIGEKVSSVYGHFTDAAQRLGVYTTQDYIDILNILLRRWKIEQLSGLTPQAEKAQEYLLTLPVRLAKIADRTRVPELPYKFKWIYG